MDCSKVPSGVRKVKKKQVKDEFDRIKQAEKKKRRLEKALATSAAIRSELEKKKQQKKEEQQRLDEEGAAIAEAVALHVLLGEDSDDSGMVSLKKDKSLSQWESGGRFNVFMGGPQPVVPHETISNYPIEGIGWVSDAYGCGYIQKNDGNSGWMLSSEPCSGDLCHRLFEEGDSDAVGVSAAGLVAAQAVSSLQIGEDLSLDAYAYVFNHTLRW